jgi:hypothetical protein
MHPVFYDQMDVPATLFDERPRPGMHLFAEFAGGHPISVVRRDFLEVKITYSGFHHL